jgi:hypothetical protein
MLGLKPLKKKKRENKENRRPHQKKKEKGKETLLHLMAFLSLSPPSSYHSSVFP